MDFYCRSHRSTTVPGLTKRLIVRVHAGSYSPMQHNLKVDISKDVRRNWPRCCHTPGQQLNVHACLTWIDCGIPRDLACDHQTRAGKPDLLPRSADGSRYLSVWYVGANAKHVELTRFFFRCHPAVGHRSEGLCCDGTLLYLGHWRGDSLPVLSVQGHRSRAALPGHIPTLQRIYAHNAVRFRRGDAPLLVSPCLGGGVDAYDFFDGFKCVFCACMCICKYVCVVLFTLCIGDHRPRPHPPG